jgi:hypothetical protein
MKFLLTGGMQKKNAVWADYWKQYEKAIMLTVDWETGEVARVVEYVSPEEVIASKESNILFKAGSIVGNLVYVCTETEVIAYDIDTFKPVKYVSLPCFNDLHHVDVIGDNLFVASTGLDMVVMLDMNTLKPVRYFNSLGKNPWHKFNEDEDYRKCKTTKPHESHPNYVFQIGEEIWVSRFEQKDAVCLTDMSKRINVGIERVHDGIVHSGKVYLTTVNGTVCEANACTLEVENIFDLNEVNIEERPLGWCRGLHVEGDKLYIGFSTLRSTKLRENLAWVKNGFKERKENMRLLPARVVEYNMTTRTIEKEIVVEEMGMSAIFAVLRISM